MPVSDFGGFGGSGGRTLHRLAAVLASSAFVNLIPTTIATPISIMPNIYAASDTCTKCRHQPSANILPATILHRPVSPVPVAVQWSQIAQCSEGLPWSVYWAASFDSIMGMLFSYLGVWF